jgi:hypothetical protein
LPDFETVVPMRMKKRLESLEVSSAEAAKAISKHEWVTSRLN